MAIDPKYLIQLAAIIETGSFSRAAENLGMTQPALSRNIKILETQAGATLVLRDRTGARPTQLGRNLAQFGDTIRGASQKAEVAASTLAKFQERELKIATTPLLAANFLCHELPQFLLQQDDLSCRVITGATPRLVLDLLSSGEADVGLAAHGPLPKTSRLQTEEFVNDNLVVIARPDHKLVKKQTLTVEDLANERWVVQRQSAYLRGQVETILRLAGLTRIDIACEFDIPMFAVEMVKTSDYLAMLPFFPVSSRIQAGEILPLQIDLAGTERDISIVYNRNRHKSDVLKAFLYFMRGLKSKLGEQI